MALCLSFPSVWEPSLNSAVNGPFLRQVSSLFLSLLLILYVTGDCCTHCLSCSWPDQKFFEEGQQSVCQSQRSLCGKCFKMVGPVCLCQIKVCQPSVSIPRKWVEVAFSYKVPAIRKRIIGRKGIWGPLLSTPLRAS